MTRISSIEYYFRVFELSPAIKGDKKEIIPILQRIIKDMGKEKDVDEKFYEELINLLDGNHCIYEIVRDLRVAGYNVSLDEIVGLINSLRAEGYVRVVSVKNPDKYERAEIVAIIPKIEEELTVVTPETVEEKIDVSNLKEEIETIFSEEKEVKPPVTPFQEAESSSIPIEIVKVGEIISDKVKFDMESLMALNTHIQHIVIATKDGLPVLQITKKDTPALDESKIAAAASVIMAMSSRTTDEIGKKGLDNVVIKTDQSLFVIGYIDTAYILTFIMDANTPIGLTLTDFNSLRKKITELLENIKEE